MSTGVPTRLTLDQPTTPLTITLALDLTFQFQATLSQWPLVESTKLTLAVDVRLWLNPVLCLKLFMSTRTSTNFSTLLNNMSVLLIFLARTTCWCSRLPSHSAVWRTRFSILFRQLQSPERNRRFMFRSTKWRTPGLVTRSP